MRTFTECNVDCITIGRQQCYRRGIIVIDEMVCGEFSKVKQIEVIS